MEWYYEADGQQQGPVELSELKGMFADDAVSRSDKVWCKELPDWTPAGEVDALRGSDGLGNPAVSTAATAEVDGPQFDVVLRSAESSKFAVIKVVQELMGVGLSEANELVDAAPSTLAEGLSEEAALQMAMQIEGAGGLIEITPQGAPLVEVPEPAD